MKLLMVIVNNDDSSTVQKALATNGYFATKLASTGGFLMSGNTTFIIGVADEMVDKVLEIIGTYSKKRQEILPANEVMGSYPSSSIEITVGGATIFVLNVERFEKL